MNQDQITFERIPEVLGFLVNQIAELRKQVEKLQPPTKKRLPIQIDEACQIIKKKKPTVYRLVQKKEIPHYKSGKTLYFYEDELLNWIGNGKKKTHTELKSEIEDRMNRGIKRKPKNTYGFL